MSGDRSTAGARLRRLLATGEVVLLPGATDAWTARLIAHAGFDAVYVTGAGIANTMLGVPDIGLTTMTEMLAQTSRIIDSVEIPVVADIDTGFGGVANVQRTIRAYEHAGVAAVHLEDQEMPKRCGHFEGKVIVAAHDMVVKLHAALDARSNDKMMIFARTDARSVEGLDAAIKRAKLYLAAGVDGIFVEALASREEFERVGQELAGVPLIANMVEGGKSPLLEATELARMGFQLVIYANLPLRLAAMAVQKGLARLRQDGTSARMLDDVLPWQDRQALVGLSNMDDIEAELLAKAAATMATQPPL